MVSMSFQRKYPHHAGNGVIDRPLNSAAERAFKESMSFQCYEVS